MANGASTGDGKYGNISFGTTGRAAHSRYAIRKADGTNSGKISPYAEIGRTGLRQWGGYVLEEWLSELQGKRGAEMYREMADQDPVIGAILFACEMLVRKVTWWVEPASSAQPDQQAQDFTQQVLFEDLEHSWNDTITEIMSMLPYGYHLAEVVYKKRNGESRISGQSSKFTDGRIGIAKLATRSQDSLLHWEFDEHDEWTAFVQQPPPTYTTYRIPREKALLFRTKVHKDNPEGRPLTLDTLVPTPQGWSTMETIQAGDQVYDETGAIRTVTGKSEIFRDRPVYEVEFSSGHVVRADAVHEWAVQTSNDRAIDAAPRILTTEQMKEWMDRTPEGSRHPGFSCGIAPVLDAPEVDLPLDPYLFGYWLGDGTRTRAAFSVCDADMPSLAAEVKRAGYSGKRSGDGHLFTVRGGMLEALRETGALEDKHVPTAYMKASPSQRLALLQGLMDSDGYSPGPDARDQASKFANTNLRLISQVSEIVRSLGGQPRLRVMERAGSRGGVIRGRTVTASRDVYEIAFYLNAPVHRLPRKVARQTPRGTMKSCGHFVKAIRRVENADTVCIEVDSPSHLFLAGEGMVPTHNSILRNAVRPYYFLKNMQNLEGVGVERDLVGMPVLTPPEGVDIWNANDTAMVQLLSMAQGFVSQVRRDEMEGVVKPFGWEFELLKGGGSRSFNTNDIITRYEQRIATSVLADMVLLGQDKVGSYALAGSKKELFSAALEAFLDNIAAVFNTYCIPRLFKLNGFQGITDWPKLCHGPVEEIDLATIAELLTAMGAAGAPAFTGDNDDVLLGALYDKMGLPSPTADDTSEGE